MSIDQIVDEELRLPPKERAMLAESLWESLGDPFKTASTADDAATVDLAVERDRQLERGEVKAIFHKELLAPKPGTKTGERII